MEHFADRLCEAVKKKGSAVCVGLDPWLSQIPGFLKKPIVSEKGETFEAAAEVILVFNKGVIDAVCDLVPCVKPQMAFYEQYGFQGVWAFEETCKYAKEKGLLVIADGKRNDIGSTAEAYANAYLGKVPLFGAGVANVTIDALTVTPYLGYDGVKPFIEACTKFGKGIFVLVKTSNPSSGDIQDRVIEDNNALYEMVGRLVESWGADEIGASGYSSVGAVVGATYPEEAAKLRALMPNAIFLVPGYGAQGASASDVRPCFNEDGTGVVVNSSRDIIFAWEKSDTYSEKEYAEAVRVAVIAMNEDLSVVL